jgi:hypothetical protein
MAKKMAATSIDPRRASSYSSVAASTGGNRDVGPDVAGGAKGGMKSGRIQTGKTMPRAAKHSVGKRGRQF